MYHRGWQALNLEMPDKIPHTEYISHRPFVMKLTGLDPDDPAQGAEAGRRMVRLLDFDLMWINYAPPNQPRLTHMGTAHWYEGKDRVDERHCPFETEEQVLSFDPAEAIGVPDVDELVPYYQQCHDRDQANFPEAVCPGGYYNSIFTWCILTFGWEMFLRSAPLDYERFDRVLEGFFKISLASFEAQARTSIKAFICHDDIVWTAGAVFHPEWYRKYVFPRYKKLWAPLKEAGKKLLFCSDGNFTEFVAGIAAAFTAYRVWHLGRMNVLGLEGIPVSLWLLFRALRGDQARARDGVALGLAAAYTFYTDVTYTVYLAGVGGLILAYHLAFERDRIWHPRCGWALAIGGCTALAVSAPLLSAMIPELRDNPIAVRSLEETKYFSADLAGFFLPSHLHPVWGKWVAPLYERAPQIKGYETYLGYTLLAFAIVAVVKRRSLDRKRVIFWAALAAASALLALGPTLHWLGRETAVPLPYRWLWYAAPILRVSRTPVRLVVITNLSLAVLLAYAIVFIRAHARPGLAAMMPAAAAVLLLAETICVPLPTNRLDIPRFYWERAKDADSYAILEAPLLDESLKRWAMTAQVVHHKPILYADPPRPSRHALDFIHANEAILGPLVGLRLAPNGGLYLLPGEPAALRPLLVRSRIRYVVVHPHAAAGPGVAALEVDFLRAAGLEEVWAEAELVAFRAY